MDMNVLGAVCRATGHKIRNKTKKSSALAGLSKIAEPLVSC
jgi:hypothetical protein